MCGHFGANFALGTQHSRAFMYCDGKLRHFIGGRSLSAFLDGLTKWIIALLTVATVVAVFIAAGKPSAISADFIPASPWNLAALGFIVALMGWMPAPLEFSAVTSVWTAKKIRTDYTNRFQGFVDFNVGYFTSAVLAIFFSWHLAYLYNMAQAPKSP